VAGYPLTREESISTLAAYEGGMHCPETVHIWDFLAPQNACISVDPSLTDWI
jgi:hypothetical protein